MCSPDPSPAGGDRLCANRRRQGTRRSNQRRGRSGTLDLRPLGPTDVLVRIEASGLCHSDISLVNGTLPGRFPVVLGHEGAGVVERVGADVRGLPPGTRVVLSAMPACGSCWHCDRSEPFLCEHSATLRRPSFHDGESAVRGASGLGTFADAVVVDQVAAVPVDTSLPADQLSIIGCAVLTGVGSVLNVAQVRPGEHVLVVGAGGVGLAAIQGARLAQASTIIAVDPSPPAREAAVASGATHAVDPTEAAEVVGNATAGRGVDAALECVASTTSFRAAWPLSRRGGRIVVVGAPDIDQRLDLPLVDVVLSGRTVVGSVYGASDAHRDIPSYVRLAEEGRLDLAALIGHHAHFDDMADLVLHPPTTPRPGRIVAAGAG